MLVALQSTGVSVCDKATAQQEVRKHSEEQKRKAFCGVCEFSGVGIGYLVDPASSHMLVLKIKPCMPRYRWTKNRDCGWLIKSVRISLVKRGMEKDNPVNCRANTRRRYFMVVTPVE